VTGRDDSPLSEELEELQAALEASRRAAEVVMPYFREGVEISYKADQTPVTEADREAERVIMEVLSAHFPGYNILGEESGFRDKGADKTWIIDPIDGTKNFIRQIPLFGIEIGLLSADQFSVGVSNMPAMDEILCADIRNGSLCNGMPARVSTISKLEQASVTFSGINLLHLQDREQAFLDVVRKVYRVRGFGDAFSFHLVATGRFEAVVQSRVNIWDVAGLVAIIEAAGGRCTDWEGRPFARESKSIVASNGLIHNELLEVLNEREKSTT
jgi:histidinol-phosphatase